MNNNTEQPTERKLTMAKIGNSENPKISAMTIYNDSILLATDSGLFESSNEGKTFSNITDQLREKNNLNPVTEEDSQFLDLAKEALGSNQFEDFKQQYQKDILVVTNVISHSDIGLFVNTIDGVFFKKSMEKPFKKLAILLDQGTYVERILFDKQQVIYKRTNSNQLYSYDLASEEQLLVAADLNAMAVFHLENYSYVVDEAGSLYSGKLNNATNFDSWPDKKIIGGLVFGKRAYWVPKNLSGSTTYSLEVTNSGAETVSLSENHLNSELAEARHITSDERWIIISTSVGLLFILSRPHHRDRPILFSTENGLSTNDIVSSGYDSKQNFYVATYNEGLAVYNNKEKN
jgi:hypothetical protein